MVRKAILLHHHTVIPLCLLRHVTGGVEDFLISWPQMSRPEESHQEEGWGNKKSWRPLLMYNLAQLESYSCSKWMSHLTSAFRPETLSTDMLFAAWPLSLKKTSVTEHSSVFRALTAKLQPGCSKVFGCWKHVCSPRAAVCQLSKLGIPTPLTSALQLLRKQPPLTIRTHPFVSTVSFQVYSWHR